MAYDYMPQTFLTTTRMICLRIAEGTWTLNGAACLQNSASGRGEGVSTTGCLKERVIPQKT